jgi:hypothetical protein
MQNEIEALLADRGMRIAVEGEAGWSVRLWVKSEGRSVTVWAVDV